MLPATRPDIAQSVALAAAILALAAPPPATPLAALCAAPEAFNPALGLALALQRQERAAGGELPLETWIALGPAIDAAIEGGAAAVRLSERVLRSLAGAAPARGAHVPEGF
jgi:hypothetical protein